MIWFFFSSMIFFLSPIILFCTLFDLLSKPVMVFLDDLIILFIYYIFPFFYYLVLHYFRFVNKPSTFN